MKNLVIKRSGEARAKPGGLMFQVMDPVALQLHASRRTQVLHVARQRVDRISLRRRVGTALVELGTRLAAEEPRVRRMRPAPHHR